MQELKETLFPTPFSTIRWGWIKGEKAEDERGSLQVLREATVLRIHLSKGYLGFHVGSSPSPLPCP